ncbi:conserved protein, unknown function [Hepatocystis sp. ex Piliocolobus tephrosceles]|nr:conserved protein, unknown function [Hepatocystis sp. ex Piliocolobus tephrosceles]
MPQNKTLKTIQKFRVGSCNNNTHFKNKKNNDNRIGTVRLMHDRNIHKYHFIDFIELSKKYTYLNAYMKKKKNGNFFYNFEKSIATYLLSKAILKEYYDINFYLPSYIYDKNMSLFFDTICLLSHENLEKSNSGFIKFENVTKFKHDLINAYNEHTRRIPNLVNTDVNCTINHSYISDAHDDMPNPHNDENNEINNDKFLCPCVPGRVNYIHIISDLALVEMSQVVQYEYFTNIKNNDNYVNHVNTNMRTNESIETNTKISTDASTNISNDIVLCGKHIKVLDIGVGANCIYPLLGNNVYKWSFVGVDVNLNSLKYCYINILLNNKENDILLKYQKNKNEIFTNIIQTNDLFFFSICNPPYHSLLEQVNKNPFRDLSANLSEVVFANELDDKSNEGQMDKEILDKVKLDNNKSFNDKMKHLTKEEDNFSKYNTKEKDLTQKSKHKTISYNNTNGCEGGEYSFIINMINKSSKCFYNVIWFTTLVSKYKHVKLIKNKIINSMRLYTTHKNKQVEFLNNMLKNDLHVNKDFYSFNNNTKTIPFEVYISQYRVFESYTGRITRWIVCWSYYNQQQINYLKNIIYQQRC